MKCLCFCYLGAELKLLPLPSAGLTVAQTAWMDLAAETLVGATVAFCVVRAVPVIWEGRGFS